MGVRRTPDRPGPGPAPAAVLRALDLRLASRVQALWPGERPARAVGAGTELSQMRPYVPGDDVRHLDPSASARTGVPHVRVHVAERALTTWLVLDASPSMAFGTADRRKADVAEGVALAIGTLATRRGNRLGVLTFGVPEPASRRPRPGRAGLLGAVAVARAEPAPEGTGATSLGEALRRAGRLARQRGLLVVVSDFRGPRDWQDELRRLRARHGVLAVEVRDRRELELPDLGADLALVDPETGRYLRVDSGSRRLRRRFAAAAAREREELAGRLRAAGVAHVVLSTEGEWLGPLAEFLSRSTVR